MDDSADNSPRVLPWNILESDEDDYKASNFPATSQATSPDVDGDEDDEDLEVEVVEQPAESAEAELS